jgi:hypothetical protein
LIKTYTIVSMAFPKVGNKLIIKRKKRAAWACTWMAKREDNDSCFICPKFFFQATIRQKYEPTQMLCIQEPKRDRKPAFRLHQKPIFWVVTLWWELISCGNLCSS